MAQDPIIARYVITFDLNQTEEMDYDDNGVTRTRETHYKGLIVTQITEKANNRRKKKGQTFGTRWTGEE